MAEADKFFEDRTFVAGERLSAADVLLATLLAEKEKDLVKSKFRNLKRYYNTVVNQPGFTKVSLKSPDQGASASKNEAADLMDQLEKAQSKPKDPFSVLPAGKFDFDDFKRKFSNFPESESIPYFWEKFDPEHYSIWLCEYKYSKDLGLVWQSCNLISSMFQRLDKMRKSAFAAVSLFGEDNNSTIAGVWVWRGQDLAFKLSEDWQVDYDSYDWKKLDPKDEETKKLVQLFFTREDDYKGYKFNQGKIFK